MSMGTKRLLVALLILAIAFALLVEVNQIRAEGDRNTASMSSTYGELNSAQNHLIKTAPLLKFRIREPGVLSKARPPT